MGWLKTYRICLHTEVVTSSHCYCGPGHSSVAAHFVGNKLSC